MARKLFISYSHYDAALLGELRVHLKPQERSGAIAPWFDGYLVPGDEFDTEVREALKQSDLIGLLVTPRFLASDYCMDVEMDDAIRRHELGAARVVPIIAKPCGWHSTILKKLLATPTDGKAITTWSNSDEAWTIVARDLEKAARTTLKSQNRAQVLRDAMPEVPARRGTVENTAKHSLLRTLHPGFSISHPYAPTDRDIDDFRHAAYEIIAEQFEAAVEALDGNLSGRFRRVDANTFTATVYRSGTKAGGCTIYTGGQSFGRTGIAYHSSDSGVTNTMSEDLRVQAEAEKLVLKPGMGAIFHGRQDQSFDPESAAAYLWQSLMKHIR